MRFWLTVITVLTFVSGLALATSDAANGAKFAQVDVTVEQVNGLILRSVDAKSLVQSLELGQEASDGQSIPKYFVQMLWYPNYSETQMSYATIAIGGLSFEAALNLRRQMMDPRNKIEVKCRNNACTIDSIDLK